MAFDLAVHLRAKHKIVGIPSTEQIIGILTAEGAIYDGEWPFGGELYGVRLGRHVAVRAGLPEPVMRGDLLHELAHYLLETGNQLRLSIDGHVRARQQERRADHVAGWILFGDDVLSAPLLTVEDLAELGNVTTAFVRRWWEIAEWEIRGRASWQPNAPG